MGGSHAKQALAKKEPGGSLHQSNYGQKQSEQRRPTNQDI